MQGQREVSRQPGVFMCRSAGFSSPLRLLPLAISRTNDCERAKLPSSLDSLPIGAGRQHTQKSVRGSQSGLPHMLKSLCREEWRVRHLLPTRQHLRHHDRTMSASRNSDARVETMPKQSNCYQFRRENTARGARY